MMSAPNAPVDHWKGPEGDDYTNRQTLPMENRVAMFDNIFSAISGREPRSVVEFGSNVGDNLWAIQHVIGPRTHLTGVEPNQAACERLLARGFEAVLGTIQTKPSGTWEMSMTRGVLIHVPPVDLPSAYWTLYNSAERYILIAEYYNPKPVEIEYRGQMGLLWKRDFAGEMMDTYPDLKLRDYGFVYHRDPQCPQDDVTWFLMEKA